MKNIIRILGISMFVLFVSCGNDDDSTNTDEQPQTPILPANYFPAAVNDYWVYDVRIFGGNWHCSNRNRFFVCGFSKW
ncbi:hypothetical protein U8527_10115 [Kordia algicida OT-1]|uniref:hypothetical protein n=1 Tax=Kordia algicida TaxID=221066 RepID=UPI003D9BAD8C